MAYGKRYTKRRSYRRRRGHLSNRYIYGKKSASSQAKQIAALRNKVSALARANRPETRIQYAEFSKDFNNSALSNNSWGTFAYVPKDKIDGNFIRYKTIKLSGILEYSDTFATNVSIDHQRTCSVRIVVYQMKQSSSNTTPLLENLIDVGSSGVSYELNSIKPFKTGTGQIVKILSNRVITLSNIQNIKRFNITINKGMLNQTFQMEGEVDQGDNDALTFPYPRGTIGIGFVCAGLHWDSSYTQQVNMNCFLKLAYTDN
ncbi:capsid protein [Chicken virus mg6_2056]|nr:capsid protein [Chicken virus mg6_2056]